MSRIISFAAVLFAACSGATGPKSLGERVARSLSAIR